MDTHGLATGLTPAQRSTEERIARRRRVRMRALAATGLSYVVDIAILTSYAAIGTTVYRTPVLYAAAAAATSLIAFLLFTSRVGETAEDFFLSRWNVLLGTILQLGFLALAPEVGLVFLTVLFIVFGFGALRMTVGEAAVLTAFATLGLILVFSRPPFPPIVPLDTPAERWVTAIAIAAALGRAVWLGLVGSMYRSVLAQRSAALRELAATLEDQVAERTRELARANAALETMVADRNAEIQTLRGILPICAHCKQIRDDQGAWNQIEAYISRHADVRFSHGICGQCMAELYSDDDDDQDTPADGGAAGE